MHSDLWSDLPRDIIRGHKPRVDIMVSPKGMANVMAFLRSQRIPHNIVLDDIEQEIEFQRRENEIPGIFNTHRLVYTPSTKLSN